MKITKKNLKKMIEKEADQLLEAPMVPGTNPVSQAFQYLMDAIDIIQKADDETKKLALQDALVQAQKTAGEIGTAAKKPAIMALNSIVPALGIGAEVLDAITNENNQKRVDSIIKEEL